MKLPNKAAAPNAGGRALVGMRTSLATRVGELGRSTKVQSPDSARRDIHKE